MKRTKRIIGVFGITSLLMVVVAITGILYAQESRTDSSPPLPPEVVAQKPLVDAAQSIDVFAQVNHLSGYTGIKLDDDNRAVVLYWKGDTPAELDTLIAGITDVTVTVESVPYSLTELLDEAERLISLPKQDGLRITESGVNSSYDGIRIGVHSDDGSQTEAQKIQAARAAFTSTFPLDISVKGVPIPFRDRWDDEEPFWGGATIDHQTDWFPNYYAYCSTSFAVTTSSGTDGILTSSHCPYGWDWYTPDGNLPVGTHTDPSSCTRGAGTITGETYDPRVYLGTWDDDSPTSAGVSGYGNPYEGQWVIQSSFHCLDCSFNKFLKSSRPSYLNIPSLEVAEKNV
jgi:hypothetical protein